MRIEPKPNSDRYDQRFIIVDESGKTIDDAGGYGYKSFEKARKAMWYRFNGGKKKIDEQAKRKREFFDQNKDLSRFLHNIWTNNFKEINRGEITEEDIIISVKKEFNIDLPLEYVGGIDNKEESQ